MEVRFNILLEGTSSVYPSNLINSNINIISDIRKYNEECREFSEILVVFEDSLLNSSFLSSIDLFQKIYEFRILFISMREDLRDLMSKYGETYAGSYAHMSYEAIRAIHLNDETSIENLLLNIKSDLNTDDLVLKPDVEIAFLKSRVKDLEGSRRVISESYERSLEELSVERETRNLIEARYKSLLDSVVKNEIVLRQFEHILSKDIYDVLEVGKYPSAPRILYIKEYQDMLYKHSLIQTLAESIRLVLRKPVKVLMLFDSSASRKIHYIPSNYHTIYNNYKQSDIYSQDFIAKVGPYKEILHMLLTNYTHIDTLIIVDCKDHTGSVVDRAGLNMVLARDKARTIELGVPSSIIVTNNPEDDLSWTYYPEYKELSEQDRLVFLSSRPLVKRFLETWG